MFRPKYPPQDTALAPPTQPQTVFPPVSLHQVSAPVPTSASVKNRRAVQLTPGSTLPLIAGGAAAVLVVGAVLVSMLLAVAITAASVAVCAVVIRSILKSDAR